MVAANCANNSSLRLTLVQQALHWEQPETNRQQVARALAETGDKHDLIILPETFSTGFTMNAEAVAESMQGATVEWLQATAKQYQATLVASLPIRENGQIFNRMLWVQADGSLRHYDKKHLFRLAGEDRKYSPGNQQVVVDWQGWRVRLLVCYDLRFPVWCRSDGHDDLQIYIANWPAPRHSAWQKLLAARAIENQCFVAGVNRCGEDDNGHQYLGGSVVHGPLGETLIGAGAQPCVLSCEVDRQQARQCREEFAFFADADSFSINHR